MLHLLIGGLAFATLLTIIGAVLLLQTERRRLRPVGAGMIAVSAALAAAILLWA
ncbi:MULTISPECIES: hypothetical protein [Jannaschia]|uniref:hypothetical protein n=1 Tax=Jannaschia TaxID=188905 RepID=UPI001C7CB6B9|nr:MULTISPECIES: hypothetical protein [unclassified Jannaschia]